MNSTINDMITTTREMNYVHFNVLVLNNIKNFIEKYDDTNFFRLTNDELNEIRELIKVNLKDQEIYRLIYIITNVTNKKIKLSMLENKRVKKSYEDFAKSIYTNISTMTIDVMIYNIKTLLSIDLPYSLVEKYWNSSGNYSWFFSIMIKNKNPLQLSSKIFKSIIDKLYDNIVIKFNNICFVVLSKFDDNINQYINLLSCDCEKDNVIVNELSYYCSNSELGLMRYMTFYTRQDGSTMFHKYLDYATETLIDLKLQNKINTQIVNFNSCIKKNKIFEETNWNDPNNLNLLKIQINPLLPNEYIENRGYLCPLLYCFSTTQCGTIFEGNYKRNIFYIDEIMREFLTNIKKNISVNFSDYSKINQVNRNYVLTNVIPFNNLEQSKIKIAKLFEYTSIAKLDVNDITTHFNDNYKTTDYLLIHYTMLGKMLDVIVDEIVGEEKNIYEYFYDLSGFNDMIYRFNINVNILILSIDNVYYNMYYSEYTVKKIKDGLMANFDSSIANYKTILKIVPREQDIIIESGVDNCFTIAGSLQCKPIEYIKQLTAVLNNLPKNPTIEDIMKLNEIDKNYLNQKYYFIGEYINIMFLPENFTKFYNYMQEQCSSSLKNKYTKYKYKYINIKNNL